MRAIDRYKMQQGVAPRHSGGGSAIDRYRAQYQQQPTSIQEESTDTALSGLLYKAGSYLAEPAAAALNAISYLDKPRGAIAGAVKAAQEDKSISDGMKKGWKENTSWKETFDPQWVQENPNLATAAGLATDIFLDPLIIATPAKAAGAIARGSKAMGLTDHVVNPAVNAFRQSETGKNVIAHAEDWAGVNRIQDAQDAYRTGRATDMVRGEDIIDEVRTLKQQYGEQANSLTDYIQAADRGVVTPQIQDALLDSYNKGKLLDDVHTGKFSKQAAFETLRDVGEEIPHYLLQETQRVAKAAKQEIPDYVYRDQVLEGIQNQHLRKYIQAIGDNFIEKNKEIQQVLLESGRLGKEAAVRFQEGSHLRRSFTKHESPEKYLDGVRKHGTEEEWRKAYQDSIGPAVGKQGFGRAHSVDTAEFAQRQILSPETMQKMGQITDSEYLIKDTLNRASKTIREDEFLSTVDKMFGVGAKEAADLSRNLPARRQYVQVPDGKSYGALAGRWVPQDVADQVTRSIGANKPDGFTAGLQKMVSWWKVAKLANPAAIMRNFYSGLPMANVFGQVPFQSLPVQMYKISKAFSAEGKNARVLRELRETGILGNGWNRQELKNILGENPVGIKKAADLGMEAFGAPDKFWRAVVFSHHRDAGKSIEEAAQIANRALFDYGSAPAWVDSLSRSGIVPFARFPYFATKETTRALYNNPTQVTKYTKIQNQDNPEDRAKMLPEHIKSKQLLPVGEGTRVVNGREQRVQNNIDLDYILPFAGDISIGGPAMDAWRLATTGRNGLGQQVIQPGMTGEEKVKEYARYAWNSLGPSAPLPYNYAGEKLYQGMTGSVDRMGRQYSPGTAIAQVFGGIKNVPINTDEMYKQNMLQMARQVQENKSIISQIKRDQRLNQAEKEKRTAAYKGQIQEIAGKMRQAQEAYKRQKKRGAI